MILIKIKPIANHKELLITNTKNGHSIGILTSYGAALNKLIYRTHLGFINAVSGYEVKEDFEEQYKNVILSPFVNRIENGKFEFDGKNYELPINRPTENNALHGFLYNKAFRVTETKRGLDNCEVDLFFNAKAEAGFPFSYEQTITYKWNGNDELEIISKIKNTSDTKMPFTFGWHPYFRLGKSVNDNELQFTAKNKIEVDENKIPNGKKVVFDKFQKNEKIEDYVFDDAFEIDENEPVILKNEELKTKLELQLLESDSPFKYLQIYTPKNRKCIALEPMTSFANAFNHKEGLTILQANDEKTSSFKIVLSTF